MDIPLLEVPSFREWLENGSIENPEFTTKLGFPHLCLERRVLTESQTNTKEV